MQDNVALLPCGLLKLNSESRILAINAYACDLLGYETSELIGRRVDYTLTMASRIYYQTHFFPLITLKGFAAELSLTLLTKQRRQIPILLNAANRTVDGEVLTFITFLPVYQRQQYEQDLVAARQLAENQLLKNESLLAVQQELEQSKIKLDRQISQLRQRNDELEQFSKVISHDLQEPLRKISVFAELLEHEQTSALSEMGQVAISGIGKASTKLRRLVSDLQLYFTLTSQLERVKVVELTEIVHKLNLEYMVSGLILETNTLPAVSGSEQELTTLFRHLIDNSVKFRKPGQLPIVQVTGSVVSHNRFQATPDKYNYVDYARIVISDNGTGFDNKQRNEVFRILKKLHPHTPGIGLGLAMAKKITERHHGLITAESVEGKGTKITLLIPIA